MRTLQAQVGSAPHSLGGPIGKSIALAPSLAVPGFVMRFEHNEEIFAEEEDADFVYQVISGAVREVRLLSDGRRHIGAFHLPGDVFGIECGSHHLCSAEAVVDCQVALVRRSALERAVEADPAAGRSLWQITARSLERLQDQLLLLGRKNAVERLASFLVRLCRAAGGTDSVDLPMSRCDIADYLGLTIETVSRTFTQLERDRAISIPSARRILLHDRAALLGLSGVG